MTKWKIYNQDVMEWAKSYEKAKFHALLCDPPYHLTSIVKRFGKKGSAPAQFGTDGVFSRSSKGFMGQEWDGGDIAFRPETWEALGEHLHPGAFGMAFSASRNWHRLAVAIEDAGFIIHPTIFGWLNGQGFPKATNISKQIDKNLGLERPKGKLITNGHGKSNLKVDLRKQGDTGVGHWDGNHKVYNETLPASELSAQWEGHRYGLQALKPAVEPIIVFQKPYEGRPLDNIVETGAGALNIDGTRIPLASGDEYSINTFNDGAKPFGNGAGHKYTSRKVMRPVMIRTKTIVGANSMSGKSTGATSSGEMTDLGRWASNFILDESVAERLDNQSGHLQSGIPSGKKKADNNIYGQYKNEDVDVTGFGDSGGASRFFFQVREQIDDADPIYYCSKVSPNERNAGLVDVPIQSRRGGRPNSPDPTGKFPDHDHRENGRNPHPTLKPISLAKYLATLLLPPDSYSPRRILIPFSGVSSEMIGAMQAGWEHIVGIEFTPEYAEIAEKRMQYWKDKYERSIS